MATRKPAAKESTSRALSVWEQDMQTAAVAQASNEEVVGGYKSISFRGAILSVDDNAVEDNELEIVVLASTHENAYYEGVYDANNPSSPVCYSFSESGDRMTPHEASPTPQDEGKGCEGCWANEFGTANVGRGKACKNVRRLVIVTAEDVESAEALAEAEPRMAKLPVTSVINWSKYVKGPLADLNKPYWGVVTKLKVVPDAKSQFKVQFTFVRPVAFDDDIYAALKAKIKEAEASIANAYPVFDEALQPQRGRGKPVPTKVVAAKGKPAPMKTKGR